MVEVINSSFIPKNEFKKDIQKKKSPRLNIFFLISLIIFLTTIVFSVVVYLWKQDLIKTNKEMEKSFAEKEEQFGLDSIREYSRISEKIEASRELLKKHYNVLPIFSYLETNTLEDITLSNLSLLERDNYITVSASGEAPVLSDLQLQSRAYADNPNVSELLLSNITKSREGFSVFDLSFSVHKKFLTERSF